MSQNAVALPTSGTLTGLSAVQQINQALDTLLTKNSGNAAPGNPQAGQWWLDTSGGAGNYVLKVRNQANTGWTVVGNIDTVRLGMAAAGANSDITSLAAVASINGGQLAGLRNRIINGGAQIQQRPNANLTNAVQFAGDCWRSCVSGATVVTVGSILTSTLSGTASGKGHWIAGATFTGGQPYWQHRIESYNVADMNGKQVTFSGKIYHDTGSPVNFLMRISKANALDNFNGGVTNLQTSAPVSIPSGAATPFSVTFNLGASDASNGLMLEVYAQNALSPTNKNFAVGDAQLEIGAQATPFEQRPIGLEDLLCKRYFEIIQYASNIFPAYQAGAVNEVNIRYTVPKRVIPTVTRSGAETLTNCSSAGTNVVVADGLTYKVVATNAGNTAFVTPSLLISAEL